MNAEAITAKIIEEARSQAAATLGEAQHKAEALRAQSDADIERRRQESEKQARAQAGELRDRMLRMAELDQRKAALAAKREVIDKAFDEALKRMQRMQDDQKRAYIEHLLLDSAGGGEELIPSQEEKDLYDEAFLKKLNESLKKAGKQGVTLSGETRPLGGGFVLKKGGMEINCAFSAVLGQARATLEAEVAQVLFN